eukprot:scaffold15943_cov68-Phaeocystis_antarctica.AAC.8
MASLLNKTLTMGNGARGWRGCELYPARPIGVEDEIYTWGHVRNGTALSGSGRETLLVGRYTNSWPSWGLPVVVCGPHSRSLRDRRIGPRVVVVVQWLQNTPGGVVGWDIPPLERQK